MQKIKIRNSVAGSFWITIVLRENVFAPLE